SQSEDNVAKAIDTAKLIPRGSGIYTEAREQIRTWRQLLIPKSPLTPSVESTPEVTPAEESQPSEVSN
ncbi:MAG: hypothetical protein ACLBM4_17530, partial [Dolichospermum sp.]